MERETFGAFFKHMRGKLGLGLREFCVENGFDPGNISKMERGKLNPPHSREKLEDYARALRLEPESADWYEFFDLAAVAAGRIPDDICEDKEVLEKMPLLFRTMRDSDFSGVDAERLMKLIGEN